MANTGRMSEESGVRGLESESDRDELPDALLIYYERPGFLVRRAHQCSVSTFMEDLKEVGITPTQMSSMAVLSETPGIDQITLARRIGVDRTTISMVVNGLARNGFISRTKSTVDARRNQLVPTMAGTAGFRLARSIAYKNRDQLVSALSPEEVERLAGLLRRITMGVTVDVPLWLKPDGTSTFGNDDEVAKDYPEHHGLYSAFGFVLRRCHQVLDALFIEECGDARLTARKFGVMFMVSHFDGLEQVTLARLLGLDPSTTATIVTEVVERGWMTRDVHEHDRRRRVVRLEPEGHAVLSSIRAALSRIEQRTLAPIPGEEQDFIWLMKRLVAGNNVAARVPMRLPFSSESLLKPGKMRWQAA